MDNLNELSAMVAPLLNDPQAMDNLRKAAEQMGLGGFLPDSPSAEDAGDNEGESRGTQRNKQPQCGDAQPDMLSMLTKLAPMISADRDDDAARLLSALRPFLSQQRARKLDEAERLLSIGRVLSIIKESKLI